MVNSIADALVMKDESLFFLTEPSGDIPDRGDHGYGLYYHDCRFLDSYAMTLAGTKLNTLVSTAADGYRALIELTNTEITLEDGTQLPMEDLGITWERILDEANLTLLDVITVQNFDRAADLPFCFTFGSRFDDLFNVRALVSEPIGELHQPAWKGNTLELTYDGKDAVKRTASIRVEPLPHQKDMHHAHVRLKLEPRERKQIRISVSLLETGDPKPSPLSSSSSSPDHAGHVRDRLKQDACEWLDGHTRMSSDNPLLDRVFKRSLGDLRILRSTLDGKQYFAAGVPWFVTLFGRDSIVAALQTLAYEPSIAAHTLRLLAKYQGTKVDEWRDEQPGKIPHELRVGELAHLNDIPQTPYYGSIDATPLFLILIARHAAWTGDLSLFNELAGTVDRALDWMHKYGDPEGNGGYIAYESKSKKGLSNQGWKDSGDSIINTDGSLAKPPIALVEVQGYAYMAKTEIADLFRRAGKDDRATQLEQEARALRERFNREFWLEGEGTYALALQRGGKQVASIASNVGRALWSGIADDDKAERTVARLLADDMFSGWGVRTLTDRSSRFNPIGYHVGTVWPHDNSLIAAGFRRYRQDAGASRIFRGILETATQFDDYQLPEVFCGFRRDVYDVPVRYPVACHPQAWAAGAIPYLLETALGLRPNAFESRLSIVRPHIPDPTNRIDLRALRVGSGHADLQFRRTGDRVDVDVVKVDGGLKIDIA